MNLRSERGIIQPPNLDDRTWQDLVDEMTALIPRYAPQWTDRSPSDLGMTLIELFAWLVEQLIYRLNRVPEKNYVAFLKLLGIPRDPPAPARTFLTFTAPQAGKKGIQLDKGTQTQTLGSEREAPVVFETDEEVTVLPISLKEILVFPSSDGQPESIPALIALPPSSGHKLTVAKRTTAQICLGFEVSNLEIFKDSELELQLRMKLSQPLPLVSKSNEGKDILPTITWTYSTGDHKPSEWSKVPGLPDAANLSPELRLQRDGVVALRMPMVNDGDTKVWAKQESKDWYEPPREAFTGYWIGIKISNKADKAIDQTIAIHFLALKYNWVSAHNALTVTDKLEAGDESDYQVRALSHRPLFRLPDNANPYGHLKITVDGKDDWTSVPDLLVDLDVDNPKKVYVVDPTLGEIRFGGRDRLPDPVTGKVRSRGARPKGTITATYRYVAGGASGNVVAGKVIVLSKPTEEQKGVSVTNPMAATGGRDEEPIDDALRRAPGLLKTRDRAITVEDYEYLAREASTEVRIVRCLGPKPLKAGGSPENEDGFDRSPGRVNVIIVRDRGMDDDRPLPGGDLIRLVHGYLDERRDLTAHLEVKEPQYLRVKVTTEFVIWDDAVKSGVLVPDVTGRITESIKTFLHPTRGGLDGSGWQLGQHVFASDLLKAIMPSADVGYVYSVTISEVRLVGDLNEQVVPENAGFTVIAKDHQLVCSAQHHDVKPKGAEQ